MQHQTPPGSKLTPLEKCPTGIRGLDEITDGGLPRGRPTLICGAAGCGKTLLAMGFIVRGAREFNEPGVFMAFEETGEYDLEELEQQRADPARRLEPQLARARKAD